MDQTIKRGDVFLCDLTGVVGSEQGGIRPAVVISNDIGNKFSPVVTVLVISSKTNKKKLPTHVEISAAGSGLDRDSIVCAEQLKTIDKWNLMYKITTLNSAVMQEIDEATMISLGLQAC